MQLPTEFAVFLYPGMYISAIVEESEQFHGLIVKDSALFSSNRDRQIIYEIIILEPRNFKFVTTLALVERQ